MSRTLDEILSAHTPASPEQSTGPMAAFPFYPAAPTTLAETGLNPLHIEDLICKHLLAHGLLSGRDLARHLCLPLKLFEDLLYDMKQRLLLAYQATSGVNDFVYTLTEKGAQKGLLARELSAYVGPAPVAYAEYLRSIEAQALTHEQPTREDIKQAMTGLVLPESFYDQIGPAIHGGRALFLYGAAGNGKTEVATRLAACFHDRIFLPQTLLIEGQLVQLYDPQCHTMVPLDNGEDEEVAAPNHDRRWLLVHRPAVVVGGEMDQSSLEIGYNSQTKVCEASLQMKGNGGVFVVDDFGRQAIGPEQLLNRWILPLEKGIDFLTLPNGAKFQAPFNPLMVFCSNQAPGTLLDEAFLRRLPYKIRMQDPTEEEFLEIFRTTAAQLQIPYAPEAAEYLLTHHFRNKRPLRGCHPRDILVKILNISSFDNINPEMCTSTMTKAVSLHFAKN